MIQLSPLRLGLQPNTIKGEISINKYIGFKMVEAKEMSKEEFFGYPEKDFPNITRQDGYMVVYPDGYKSWSPKEVFEKAYMQVGDNNTITQDNVDDFVKSVEVSQLGEKTTITKTTLNNGFIIVESSSCVDPENFNMAIGTQICVERTKNKVWELLGFLLQTAKNEVIRED